MVEGSFDLDQFDSLPPGGKPHGGCASCGIGQAFADSTRCGNGLEKIYPTTAVRFGYLRYIGEFSHVPDMKFTCGAKVVIQTRRGIEMGDQVSLTCTGCDKSVTREQMREWVKSCGEDSFIFDAGRILREATAADLAEYTHIQAGCREKRNFCQRTADRYKLPLRVVESEHVFGGERILFYFTAEERIDFRSMVRDLTTEYRTRIEMRQVGARDEARLLADYETCGREVCCKVFLKTLRPITMRMAKLQKATLDPTQVSGRCGRLKCCLRYEHVGYEELDKKLPRTGIRIRTNHGEGVIVNRQVLTQLVQIRKDDGTLVSVVAEDITEVGVEAPPRAVDSPDGATPGRPVAGRSRTRGSERPIPGRAVPRRLGAPAPKSPPDGPIEVQPSELRSAESRPSESRPVESRPKPEPSGAGRATESAADEAAEGKPGGPHQRRRRGRRRRGRRGGGSGGGGEGAPPASGG
ncbi:MAG: regulatory iron-sulfur-containing complex subunit RicT [Planctomycetota bacterium]